MDLHNKSCASVVEAPKIPSSALNGVTGTTTTMMISPPTTIADTPLPPIEADSTLTETTLVMHESRQVGAGAGAEEEHLRKSGIRVEGDPARRS